MFVTFKGFKGLNKQITDLSGMLSAIGCCDAIVSFLCNRLGLDREYYRDWLYTKDVRDVAELIILYLSEETKEAMLREFAEVAALN
jgi:hypothetical protein